MLKTIKTCLALAMALAMIAPAWPSPAQAAGASLFLAPSSGNKTVGSSFTVSVKVNSGGNVINAAEGRVTYDPALLEATGISKSGSIFPLWTTEPKASGGAIPFGGGLFPPYFNGASGQLLSVTFKAKAAGSARVGLANGAVLANDGKGTNIISGQGSATFTITAAGERPEAPKTEPKPAETEPEYLKPAVTSPTHPDQNAWYREKKARFKWDLPSEVSAVSYLLDDKPASDPGNASDGRISEAELEAPGDGAWYFHVKFKDAKRWGAPAHYRLLVDSTPPEPFAVEARRLDPNDWPELFFKAEDSGSGLAAYEVYVGSLEHRAYEVPADAGSQKLVGLEAGDHTTLVKAVDKAGNERVAMVTFRVEPIAAPELTDYPSEIRPGDRFYARGTALPDSRVVVFIERDGRQIASSSAESDPSGRWSMVHGAPLQNGRYSFWAVAVNARGLTSGPSAKPSFLVTPPVFAVVGGFVLQYFTVLVSLIFLIVLTLSLIFLIVWLFRKKLKKEAYEVEEVLKRNSAQTKELVSVEFAALAKAETKVAFKAELPAARDRINEAVDKCTQQSLKEIQDVEKIIK